MKSKAKDMCPRCTYCEGSADMVEKSYYVCGVNHSNGGLYHLMPAEDELYCTAFEGANMNKVEGKASDVCPNCKNCKVVVWEGEGVSNIECEDPYDGLIREMSCDDNIRCSMFEIRSEKKEEPCDKIPLLQHELEMEKLRTKIHQLEKEKAAHLKGIERLKNKNEKYLKKIIDQQATHYKQCARILELECAVNKLQSGEYDDILAKDIEIKSLQAKYEDAMSGWNHTMELYDKLKNETDNLNEEKKSLTNMVERRDRWVKELQSDVYTLQNEVLTIRDIAQKAYDDTNRD